eukprot:Skav223022  [mRNA]  locus=scaffold1422:176089:179772:+ [translate_table: standard]
MEQHAEFSSLLERALDQREHLASLARDAVEHRFRATNESLHALREDVAKHKENSEQEMQCLGCRIDAVLDQMAQVEQSSRETAEASAHVVNSTLADFLSRELHTQANACRDLRGLTSSIARGVVRLAQVCGVLPGSAFAQKELPS